MADNLDGLVDAEMAWMRLAPEGIEHQQIQSAKKGHALLWNVADIGAVGDIANAKTEDFELCMDQRNGSELLAKDVEGRFGNLANLQPGNVAGRDEIRGRAESICKGGTNLFTHF